MTKELVGFKCFYCGIKFGPEAKELPYYMPCGCSYDWLRPKLSRKKDQRGLDSFYIAEGHGITLDHPFEEKCVLEWRAKVREKLSEQNSIYREVVDGKTVVSSPSTNDFMASEDYPGYPGFRELLKPGSNVTSNFQTPILVYVADTDIVTAKANNNFYASHRQNQEMLDNANGGGIKNFFAPCQTSAKSMQEAVDKFIAAGKPKS